MANSPLFRRPFLLAFGIIIALGLGLWITLRIKSHNQLTLTDPLRKGPIMESVYGIGTVTADKSFQLKPGVTTTVERLFVKEGDQVKRGQKLVDLDSARFSAPFDGTVTALPVKEGETVFAQSIVLVVVDLTHRYLVVSLEQRAALKVKQGQASRLSFEELRDESFEGLVESVYSNQSNFYVRISAPHLPPQILPGMTADVAISIAEKPDALLVPVAAIEKGVVLVHRGRSRQEVAIKTGVIDGETAEVVSGDLHEGDRLEIRRQSAP